jgi:hypothetical protein
MTREVNKSPLLFKDMSGEETLLCPKCGRPAWAPYRMKVMKKYGKVYTYQVFRHPDGRRHTPRKCTVRVQEGT